jgi:thiol-disulfide isomerase/thioredoxin
MANPRNRPARNGGADKGRPTTGKRDRAAARRSAARRRRALQIGLVAAGAALVALVGVLGFRGSSAAGSNTSTTGWDLPELNGHGRVTLAQFHGHPTVVNFFASWCEVCDAELPGFHDVAQQARGQVNFVGVDSLETGDRNYMPRRHHLADAFAALARDVGGANNSGLHDALGGGSSMPLTAFYDANGKLLTVRRTEVPEPALRQMLQRLYRVSTTGGT